MKKPTRFRSVTVPDQSQYSPVSYTKEYLVPFDKIKSNITPGAPKKFYLSRKDYEDDGNIGVHCCNEKYFEDFFVARGFEAVSIETLSIEEQISLIMGADEIAATLGTLTHWAIFCKPNTKLIMLNRTDSYVSLLQCFVNEISGVEYYIVDASKNFLPANRTSGVCMLGSNKYWKAFVADYFGEQIDEDDYAPYFNDALDNYVNVWCKKYPPTNNLNLWTDLLKTLCNRIVALENHMKRPLLTYQTHVGMKGWQPWKFEDQYSNPLDQQCDIQAIKINFSELFHDVYYAVYFNDREGWSQEVSNGAMAGTTGQKKSITGIKIRLDSSWGGTNEFDILYRVHIFDGVWSPWAQNGEEILSQGIKLNAVQISLKAKSAE